MRFLKGFLKIIAILLVCIAALVWYTSDQADKSPFEPIGYYKSEYRHRLQTFRIKRETGEEKILEHARSQPYTPPNISAVWYYERDAKIPNPTLARNMEEAWGIISDKRYTQPKFVYWRVANLERHIDCMAEKEAWKQKVCRQGP